MRIPFKNELGPKKKVHQKIEIAFNFIKEIPLKNFRLQFYIRNPFKIYAEQFPPKLEITFNFI